MESGFNSRGGYGESALQKKNGSLDESVAGEPSSPESLPEPKRPPLRHIDKYIRPECPCLSKRYTVAVLACLGFIIMFAKRHDVALISAHKRGTPSWSPRQSLIVNSSIFWGYFITQIPAGFWATKYPANKLFGFAIVTSSVVHLFVPGAMSLSTEALAICIGLLQGLAEGLAFPACHGIWRYWAPPLERSRLATLAFSGTHAAAIFAQLISGELIKRLGWQAPFYFYCLLGFVWWLNWLWLVFEKPSKHPTIEAKELLYIESSVGSTEVHTKPSVCNTPWKAFFTSLPVYAILIASFCRSYNFYLLVLFQPKYFKDMFNMDLETSGFLGMLPHLLMTIFVVFGGILADYLRKTGILTTTQVRKLFNCGGFAMQATFFLVLAYAKSKTVALSALYFGVAFSSFAVSGFNVNHLDIAPKYASILMGLSNAVGILAGVAVPFVVVSIQQYAATDVIKLWKIIFIVAAIVHCVGITFYAFFASGELQPWAKDEPEEDKN